MRLEEAHLSDLLSADARCSDVRDRARRKFQTRIRGVDLVRQNRNSHCVDFSDVHVFADEPLHDVEIVNHQIEHDVDIERARRELADAMNLKVNGIAYVRAEASIAGLKRSRCPT